MRQLEEGLFIVLAKRSRISRPKEHIVAQSTARTQILVLKTPESKPDSAEYVPLVQT